MRVLSKRMETETVQVVVNILAVVIMTGVGYVSGWWSRGQTERKKRLDALAEVHVVHP